MKFCLFRAFLLIGMLALPNTIAAKEQSMEEKLFAEAKEQWKTSRQADDRAVKTLDKAIKINPKRADYYNLKAQWLWNLEDDDKLGLQSAEKSIALNPMAAYPWLLKAKFLGRLNRNEEALSAVNTAITLSPEAHCYYDKAQLLKKMGHYKESEKNLDTALKLSPDDIDSLAVRADLRMQSKNYKGVLADTDAALKTNLAPMITIHRRMLLLRAEAYRQLKDYSKARKCYEDALKLFSSDRNVASSAQKFFAEIGDKEMVQRLQAKLKQLDSDIVPLGM